MRARSVVSLVFGLLVIGSTPAFAQDEPSYGLTMGYPGGVGVMVPVNENLAVRPTLAFSWTSTESDLDDVLEGVDLSDFSIRGTTVSLDVAVLFYLDDPGALRTYFAPAFTYRHAAVTTSSPFDELLGDSGDADSSQFGASGSFGAQYAIGPRFEVFGEAGLAFRTSSDSGVSSKDVHLQSGAGVIFRF